MTWKPCPHCDGTGAIWSAEGEGKRRNHEGSVFQRSQDGRWVAQIMVNGMRRTRYGKDEADAWKKLRQMRRAMRV